MRGPAPAPGSILPASRIVAYYGNPLSKRMGILGALPPEQMLARLAEQIRAWERADPATPVRGALQLIVTVAQASPGPRGLYRMRMPDSLIQRVAGWAARKNYLLILDVQVGRSTVKAELTPLLPYLALPNVQLALDPEFSMKGGRTPGRVIGTMSAADVNVAVDTLAALVTRYNLPPKVLIVHRFTRPMVTGEKEIRLDPRVQVVMDMDGFGSPRLKRASYRAYIHDRPVQYAGFKIFYKQDTNPMTPEEVLRLDPVPVYVMYQ